LPCAVAAIAQMTSGSGHAAERRYFNVRDDVKFRFRHRVTVDSGRPSVIGLREQPQALPRILKWNKLIISLRL
jgi:hypothetical protein